jgi:hypothetical protein
MTLAEKGAVSEMIGGQCCTFTCSNTTTDCTITKALQGLTTLANELTENSGVDDPFHSLMEQWFEKWKGMMAFMFTSLIITLRVMTTVGAVSFHL